ncbi:MAG TPA: tRNA pseudouridine(55) synthase TruB [Acidimicrobiales bacterium]|nr:tRNA pseudouridine(55) synthase TruB [Acidimicrobiales bacterium]
MSPASAPARTRANGFAVVDKPAGPTSHDVVARCRRIFSEKRAGHAGSLDPDATGVLLVGLGPSTRLMQFFSGLPKSYSAEIVLGVATTTLDAAGEVTATWDMGSVGLEDARAAALALTGAIEQVPPMVSALKVGGKRLHALARAGIEVERAARRVEVTRFDIRPGTTGEHGPVLEAEVDCSAGTYVRVLAADLGQSLGGGAHLRNLRRTAVGEFTLAEAVPLGDLEGMERPHDAVVAPAAALRRVGAASAMVDAATAGRVAHGAVLALSELEAAGASSPGPWAVSGPGGDLLAVYGPYRPGQAKPIVVLATS